MVALVDSSSPMLRAKVTSVPAVAETPTGSVSFGIDGSGPVQRDGLATNTLPMTGGVATCKVSALPASTSPWTAQATYGGDGNFTSSDGTFTTTATTQPTTTTTTAPTTTTTTTTQPSTQMAPPSGYTAGQRIFEDQFLGTTLDTFKWNTTSGANGGLWNDFGIFTNGNTGPNTPSSTDTEWWSPSQVSVNNGLSLTAVRDGTAETAPIQPLALQLLIRAG